MLRRQAHDGLLSLQLVKNNSGDRRHPRRRYWPSENDLPGQRENTRAAQRSRNLLHAGHGAEGAEGGLSIGAGIMPNHRIRIAAAGVIEGIERLCPELKLQPFIDCKILEEGNVLVREARTH